MIFVQKACHDVVHRRRHLPCHHRRRRRRRQHGGLQHGVGEHRRHAAGGHEGREPGAPPPVEGEGRGHHRQRLELRAAEEAHPQPPPQEGQQQREVYGVAQQRGHGGAVDAHGPYQAVVEHQGARRQYPDEEQPVGVVARVVEYVGAYAERRVEHLGQPEDEHHAGAPAVVLAVGYQREERVEVDPDDVEYHEAHHQLVQAHLPSQAVHLLPVALLHRRRYHGPRYGAQRAVGHLDDVGYEEGYGVDARQRQPGLGAEEQRPQQGHVAGQHRGRHEERVAHHVARQPRRAQVPPVDTEDAQAEMLDPEQVDQVEQHGQPVAAAEEPHESVERDDAVAVEQIGRQGEHPDAHLAHHLGHRDAHQHRGAGLEDRQVEREEYQHRQQAEVVGQQGRVDAVYLHEAAAESQQRQPHQGEARQRQQQRQAEEAVVVAPVFEPREEAHDGGVGAQLRYGREEHGGIHHHARQSHLLGGQHAGEHEEGGDEPYRHPQVVGHRPLDALSRYDTHNSITTHLVAFYCARVLFFSLPASLQPSSSRFRVVFCWFSASSCISLLLFPFALPTEPVRHFNDTSTILLQ